MKKNFYLSIFKKKFLFFLSTLLFFLSSCGCPRTEHRTLNQESVIEETVNEALSSPFFADLPWPEEGWWKLYDDPTLEFLISEGLTFSPTIEKASILVRSALSDVKVAKSALYPLLFGTADIIPTLYTRTGIFPPNPFIPFNYRETDLTLNLDYELDLWKKNRNRFCAQKDFYFAEVQNRQYTHLVLSISIAESYFSLASLKQIESIQKRIIEKREQKQGLIAAKVKSSLENQLVLLKAEQNVLMAKTTLFEIQRSIEIEEHALANLVGNGTPLPCIETTLSPQSLFPFPLPACLALDVLSRKPEIQAQLWRIEGYARIVKVRAADFFPNVNISGLLGYSTIFPEKLLSVASSEYQVGPAIHLPIFPREVLYANLDLAYEEFSFAVEEYNQLILNGVQEVLDALTLIQKFNQEWSAILELYESTQKSLHLVEVRQKRLSSALDLLDQEELNLQIQMQKVAVEEKLLIATLKMIKALGG